MFYFMHFILLLVGAFAIKNSEDNTPDHLSILQTQMQAVRNPHMNIPAAVTTDTAASALPEQGWQLAEEPRVESSLLANGDSSILQPLLANESSSIVQPLLANESSSILQDTKVKTSAIMAEFIAMTLFVVIGCGSAMSIAKEPGSAWIFQVSLTFGLAITVLAYTIGHYSGGQINCAVTLGLVLRGQCTIAQGMCNFVAQLLGSITGSFILFFIYPREKDLTGGLGTNSVGEGWGVLNALIGEFMMTFLLVFVVLETATNPASEANRALAPIAIGFAVFLAHSVLIPIDGCSINPTRSFGPAVVGLITKASPLKPITDMWIFWVGPLLGAAAAAGAQAALAA